MKTILDCVLDHAARAPERVCFRLVSRVQEETTRTFAEVATAAGRVAAALSERGVRRGDVVILVGTHHVDFYAAWLGAVWIGAIPSVLAEPSVRIDKQLYWTRLRALLDRIDARLLLHDPRVELDAGWPAERPHATYDAATKTASPVPARAAVEHSDLLLLQHSSGTTGLHKGVMLSHGAIMRHAESYLPSLSLRDDDVVATWLPLYHDMGLIACFVCPLIAGIPVVWLSPFEWVASPAMLMQAISRHRATLAWLPNFAYAFLAQRTRDPAGSLHLSSLRAVINCSEPVTADAMDAFATRFAGDGFRGEALHTCYAMAENAFAVSASTADDPPRRARLDERIWRTEHRAAPVGADTPALVHVSNGRPVRDCEVRIFAADGTLLPAGSAGRILIRSPFLLSGYFRRDDLNASLLDAEGFFDTGDIGWLNADGHVFVTGRQKDVVIVGGRNVYPQDIEQIANEVEGVHPGRVVCFGVGVVGLGTEGLVVLAESDLPEERWPDIAARIRAAVPARLDLDLADVRVLSQGILRKSTSGKLARGGNREWYLEGRFGALPRHVKLEDSSR